MRSRGALMGKELGTGATVPSWEGGRRPHLCWREGWAHQQGGCPGWPIAAARRSASPGEPFPGQLRRGENWGGSLWAPFPPVLSCLAPPPPQPLSSLLPLAGPAAWCDPCWGLSPSRPSCSRDEITPTRPALPALLSCSFPALLAPGACSSPTCRPPAQPLPSRRGVPRDAWGCPSSSVPRWDSLMRCQGAGQSPLRTPSRGRGGDARLGQGTPPRGRAGGQVTGGGHREAGPCRARRWERASRGHRPVPGGRPEPCPCPRRARGCAQGAALGIPESPPPGPPCPSPRAPVSLSEADAFAALSLLLLLRSSLRAALQPPGGACPAQPGPARHGPAPPAPGWRREAAGTQPRGPGQPRRPPRGGSEGARLSQLPPSPWQDVAPLPDPAGALLHPPLPRQHHRALVVSKGIPGAGATRAPGSRAL